MTTKTNEEWIEDYLNLVVPADKLYIFGKLKPEEADWLDGFIISWLRTVLEAKDQQIAEAVEAERERFEMIISGGEVDVFAPMEYKNGYIQCAKDIQEALTTPNEAEK